MFVVWKWRREASLENNEDSRQSKLERSSQHSSRDVKCSYSIYMSLDLSERSGEELLIL